MQAEHSVHRIEHSPLWKTVTDQLRILILSGEIPAEAHIVETDLATRMGVSRGPIRQALARLEQEGFVEIVPRQGARVVALTADLVHEKYELRRLLEEYAAGIATCRCTSKDVEALQQHCEAMRQAVQMRDFEGFYLSQYRFHREIVSIANMSTLLKLWDLLGMGIGSLMLLNLYYANPDDALAARAWESQVALGTVTGHEELARAIAEGGREAAVQTMHRHLCAGERAVLQALARAMRAWQARSSALADERRQS